jgi:hypothetical protein
MTVRIYQDAIKQLREYMQSGNGFKEQPDTGGRRFHYYFNGNPVAYVSFKHIWGGYKFFRYANDTEAEVIESLDHLKKLTAAIEQKTTDTI